MPIKKDEPLIPALEPKRMFHYRILRYVPNIVRDEWVNIGVLLEDSSLGRHAIRLIEEPSEIARVRRVHPDADEDLLRALPEDFEARMRGPETEVSQYIEKLERNLSNVIQFGPRKGLLGENFGTELARLYLDHVTPPSRHGPNRLQSMVKRIKEKLNDVFRRHRILGKLQQEVRIEGFTEPGDPMKLDYGYQNGARGFIHAVDLRRDIQQAKVLAYTAMRIHARDASAEMTAITEVEPDPDKPRHQFARELFSEQSIRIVPLKDIEGFAEELRVRLN
jgi:hypothetical protein